MKKNSALALIIVIGFVTVVLLERRMDARRPDYGRQFAEEPLYVSGKTARRLSLAFNGLVSDWYWMRSLQYVGRKILAYEDTENFRLFGLQGLSSLDLRLLPSLLDLSTTLDPQFMAPYEYGAVLLPEISQDQAIALLNKGIENNPSSWRLYQHLGYIYWQKHDYNKASEVYGTGAKLPGAPAWMSAISARMKAEGGSREAAREMYGHIYEASTDQAVREMVIKQLMRLDSLDQGDLIRKTLADYQKTAGRCASSWLEVAASLRSARLRLDGSGAPLDPSDEPYVLTKNGCEVGLGENSKVPRR